MEYGLIGEHLPHSYSKVIHEAIGAYSYELHEVAKENLDAFLKAKDFKAINVTIPYKQDVIPYLDEIAPQAEAIGAVNTIVNRDGKLCGYNTDYFGLKELILRTGIEIEGRRILILGTGGTSKTAAAVVADLGTFHIIKVSRSGATYEEIAAFLEKDPDFKGTISRETIHGGNVIESLKKQGKDIIISYDLAYTYFSDCEVIINTTPAGMYPNLDGCAIDVDRFSNLEGVVDVVYNPLDTKLVRNAKARGVKATGGLFMLVAQAVKAYEIFLDTTADEGLYEKIYHQILSEKRNIVLTGMPGSGKSTVGRRLESLTGRRLYELDDMIVEKAGMEITDIFAKYGEEHFRDLETEVVREVAKEANCIISTGGGCILRPENVELLKQNGRLFFLDRPLEQLLPTDDRPLASSAEAIKKRFEERYDLYCYTADVIVSRPENSRAAADTVLKKLF